jgi:aspyridone synthetase trans-acting enoyl reductase
LPSESVNSIYKVPISSGLAVIATCSPHNFDLVKSLGATAVFDYRSQSCAKDIRDFSKDSLSIVLDCITDATTMKICYEAMGSCGGKYTGLDAFPMRIHTRNDITPHWIFVATMFGEPLDMKGPYKRRARRQDVTFVTDWFVTVQDLLDNGLLKPHPIRVMPGGLGRVAEGIAELRLGKVSGEKLVYKICER